MTPHKTATRSVVSAVVPFQRFLDDNRDDVWRFLVAAVGRQDADDCFQETFIAALRAYPELKPDSNLRGWVLTIANRKAIDHHRATARRPIPSEQVPEQEHHDEHPDREIWDRVRQLPEKQRAAILLRYAADMTHRDVAAALDCSEDAARQSAHEGLEKLRTEVTA
jgi:RNA polymerase sigma factor (sigma-70 family)